MTLLAAAAAFLRDPGQFFAPRLERECPVCGHRGAFFSAGRPPRYEARCPRCRSRERHRLLQLYFQRHDVDPADGRRVLHVAPERHFVRTYGASPNYQTADITPGKAALTLDLQATGLPDSSFDLLLANHVLEHVPDDLRALREVRRILAADGVALLTAPQDFARETTYEVEAAATPSLRFAHYGDPHHFRLYGRDLGARIAGAGFSVSTFRATDEEIVRYALLSTDIVYVARRAGA